MGAIYSIETMVTVTLNNEGGNYVVGVTSNGSGPLPKCPASGFIRKIAITRRNPGAGVLPGGGTFSFMLVAGRIGTSGTPQELDYSIYAIVNEMSIAPSVGAAPAYGATGMIYWIGGGPAPACRAPDIILNGSGMGYPYALGIGSPSGVANGELTAMIQLDGQATREEEFLIQIAVEGMDTLQGEPASYYRLEDIN